MRRTGADVGQTPHRQRGAIGPWADVYLWRLLFDRDSYTKESVAGGPGVAGHTETGHTERGHTETGHMEAGR